MPLMVQRKRLKAKVQGLKVQGVALSGALSGVLSNEIYRRIAIAYRKVTKCIEGFKVQGSF